MRRSCCIFLVAMLGCTPKPHPTGDGVRVEPRMVGSFKLVRGTFPPPENIQDNPGVVGTYLLRGPVIGDCDGDGLEDVYDPATSKLYVQRPGGMFEEPGGILSMDGGSAAVFADLALDPDGPDGNEDLIIAGMDVRIYKGLGGCRFAPPVTISKFSSGFGGQIIVRDIDHDGLADLAITRTTASDVPYRLLIAVGDGSFVDATPPPTPSAGNTGRFDGSFLSYVTWFDDIDGDGADDQFVIIDHGYSWMSWGRPSDAPAFARDDSLSNLIAEPAPMGLSPLDADRDGRTDYFLAIGKQSILFWNRGPRDLVDVGAYAGVLGLDTVDDWGTLAFDADRDGWPDLMVLRMGDADFSRQPIALFINRHDGTFADVAGTVFGGAKLRAQSLVCGDLQSDGRMSCLAREPAGNVLLENHLTPEGHWLGLRLLGTVSSADASGARVSLEGEKLPLVVSVDGQSPSWSEHRRDVLIAIGQSDKAAVSITWPSGITQTLYDLPAGRYSNVTEPRVLSVARRVARADGTTLVGVTVDPTIVSAREVTIERSGDGAWEGPAQKASDGKWMRTLRAPSSAGSARIEVSLDGKPLVVRPRVRFVAGN